MARVHVKLQPTIPEPETWVEFTMSGIFQRHRMQIPTISSVGGHGLTVGVGEVVLVLLKVFGGHRFDVGTVASSLALGTKKRKERFRHCLFFFSYFLKAVARRLTSGGLREHLIPRTSAKRWKILWKALGYRNDFLKRNAHVKIVTFKGSKWNGINAFANRHPNRIEDRVPGN